MSKPNVIVIGEGDELMITTLTGRGTTCIYVSLENGKLVLTGGASIIARIEGEGMLEKVVQ